MKKQAEFYYSLYKHITERIPESDMSINVPAEIWEKATAIWRNAWRDVNVCYCYNGNYKCGKNYFKIKHIYLPQYLSVSRFELGKNLYSWSSIIHVTEEFCQDGTYIVTRKKDKGDLTDEELEEILFKKNQLVGNQATAFLHSYQKRLISCGIQSEPESHLIHGWNPLKDYFSYIFAPPLERYKPEQTHTTGILRLRQHSDAACLFFAATVFSLLKQPMRCMMKNDAEHFQFALYVYSEQRIPLDSFFEHALHYANMYCNFRSWGDPLTEKYQCAKFCYQYPWECNGSAQLACWNHLYFPVSFTSDHLETDEDSDFESERTKKEKMKQNADGEDFIIEETGHKLLIDNSLEDDCETPVFQLNNARKYLKKLSCLPVLILHEGAGGQQMKNKNILSLSVDFSVKRRPAPIMHLRHIQIMDGYVGFLENISHGGEKEFRAACKAASKNAYRDLGVLKKDATRDQHYQAKFLSSIYVAEHYAEQNTLFMVAAKDTLVYLKKHIAHLATAGDFARFLGECDRTVSFYQDDTGIYLHYKQYWSAFQAYCKDRGIVLKVSAAQFRKTVLKHYIRPQYQVSGDNYPRYDYRKKVDGQEATVLNVDPKILKLLKS